MERSVITKAILILGFSTLLLTVSFIYGFKKGFESHGIINSIILGHQSSLLDGKLSGINDSAVGDVRSYFDSMVTGGITVYPWYLENGNQTLVKMLFYDPSEMVNNGISNMVKFRRLKPEKDMSHIFSESQQQGQAEYIKGFNERKHFINSFVAE